MASNLETLGQELKVVDRRIMELVAQRMGLAYKVGILKYLRGEIISRPTIESDRIDAVKEQAISLGLNPHFAGALLYQIIDEACKEQMRALQCGTLLQENIMKLGEFGIETHLKTTLGGVRAIHLNPLFLSSQDRAHIFGRVYPIAMDAFGQQHSDKFAHDVRVHVLEHKNLLVIQDGDKSVAFAAWDFFEKGDMKIVYLAGMCVAGEYQRHIAGRSMIEHIVSWTAQAYPDWSHFALRTQNWAMQKCLERIADTGLYQKFGDESVDPDLQDACSFIAEQIHDPYLDSGKLVSRGIYGACLYGSSANLVPYPGIDSASGDAAYCLWRR